MRGVVAVTAVLALLFVVAASSDISELQQLNGGTAVQAAISPKGISAFFEQFVPEVEQSLQGLRIPDVKEKKDEIGVYFENIVLSKVSTSSATISTSSSGARISLNGIGVQLTGHYKVCEELIGHNCFCDGGVTILASGATSLSVTVQISESGGVPVVTASSPSFNLDNWDLDGLCHLLSWIVDIFQGDIRSAAESAVRGQMVSGIEQAAKQALSKITFKMDLTEYLGIDYHLTTGVVFSASDASVGILGGVYIPKTGAYAPFSPSPLPAPTTNETVTAYVSDSVANSAAWAYFTSDMLRLVRNGTGLFEELQFEVNVTKTPDISVNASGLVVDAEGMVSVVFVDTQEFCFDMKIHFVLIADVYADNEGDQVYLFAQIPELDVDDIEIDFEILHQLFPVDPKWLKPILSFILKEATTIINPMLKKDRIPLPQIPAISVSDVHVITDKGYIAVDLVANPAQA